ncbi:unnamed protein product [Laminaria digitata]
MAQSVRGLRQSAALCAGEELPLTIDLLQGSEAVTAVLRRCESFTIACDTRVRTYAQQTTGATLGGLHPAFHYHL